MIQPLPYRKAPPHCTVHIRYGRNVCLLRIMLREGAGCRAGKHLERRAVQAKAFTPYSTPGAFTCAVPCRLKSSTRLDASPLSGIPAGQTGPKKARQSRVDEKRQHGLAPIKATVCDQWRACFSKTSGRRVKLKVAYSKCCPVPKV